MRIRIKLCLMLTRLSASWQSGLFNLKGKVTLIRLLAAAGAVTIFAL